ncbi:MAG: aminotransferase class V-fold PLP-dependent enzyme [Chthoniobacterales bacterium]
MTSSAAFFDKTSFDPVQVRRDFPILDRAVAGKPLVYLDNAATTQKPQVVIDAIQRFYMLQNSNIHRGVHYLSAQATDAYEEARQKIANFLGAASASEIVFVRGATEAINLIAQSFGGKNFQEGDEVVISEMEHHANIVPWQLLSERVGIKLRVVPITDAGEIDLEAFYGMLNERTRLVSVVHVSNTLGTVNPVEKMIKAAHEFKIPFLLDGAQSAPHMRVDVQKLGCDFFVCSSHKMFGPTGVGVLWGRAELLNSMPPWQGGGDMIRTVSFEKSTYKDAPGRFEAGTPHIAGAIALGAAVDYIESLDRDAAEAYEADVLAYAEKQLSEVDGLQIHGAPAQRVGAVSFSIENAHPHDIGTILDSEGIAIRAGHHCTQPLMRRLGVPATARPSFSIYNTHEEVDMLVRALQKICKMFA